MTEKEKAQKGYLYDANNESKMSVQRKRYRCFLDMDYMESVVFNPQLFS